MVGLSIVLEGEKSGVISVASSSSSSSSSSKKVTNNKSNIIVNKTNMIINNNNKPSYSCSYFHSQSQTASFLDHCFLCSQKLLPGKDIYMYRGDRAFCSVECRCRQIFMDEEESKSNHIKNCSIMAAMKPSSSSSSSRHRKGTRNRAL